MKENEYNLNISQSWFSNEYKCELPLKELYKATVMRKLQVTTIQYESFT